MNYGFVDDQENAAGRGTSANDETVGKVQVLLLQVPSDAAENDPNATPPPCNNNFSKDKFLLPNNKLADSAALVAIAQIADPDDVGFLDCERERCDSGSRTVMGLGGLNQVNADKQQLNTSSSVGSSLAKNTGSMLLEDFSTREAITNAELKVLEDVAGVSFLYKPIFVDHNVSLPTKQSISDAPPTIEELEALSTIAGVSFRSNLYESASWTERTSATIEELSEPMLPPGEAFVFTQACLRSETILPRSEDANQSLEAKCPYKRFTLEENQHDDSCSDCDDEDLLAMADGNLEDLIKIMTGETLDCFEREGSLSGSTPLAPISGAKITDNNFSVSNAQGSELLGSNNLVQYNYNKTHSRSESGLQNDERQILQRRMSEELELEDKMHSPNRPHPALEYPPLYFILRRLPWLFERVKTPYAFRWRVMYPLQKNVPFSLTIRKVGIYLTWGELLLLIPFFSAVFAGILYTVFFPSVAATGKVARFAVIVGLVLAQRNSLFTLLVGVPFDRAIFYHKLAGRVAGITGILHTVAFFLDPAFQKADRHDMLAGAFTGQVNISGSVFMLLIVAITVTSLPPIRRRFFEIFYVLHLIFTAGMVACAFFHTGKLVPILALLTWGTDRFIRSIVMARTRYPRKAFLKRISETVVEISFPKTAAFAYNPGQYIYIAIPEISWLQWHPFSISSSPKQRVVTLHVRKAGDWTAAMFDLSQMKQEVSILIEGPYGSVGIDIANDKRYKNIMLISGGIGSEFSFHSVLRRRKIVCLITSPSFLYSYSNAVDL